MERKRVKADIDLRLSQIKGMNGRLIKLYEELDKNHDNVFKEIPGLKDLILSNICTKEFIDYIRDEYNH